MHEYEVSRAKDEQERRAIAIAERHKQRLSDPNYFDVDGLNEELRRQGTGRDILRATQLQESQQKFNDRMQKVAERREVEDAKFLARQAKLEEQQRLFAAQQ